MTRFSLPLLCCVVLLGACSREGGTEQPADGAETTSQPTNVIALPASVRRNLGITFARAEPRHVERVTRLPGSFELLPTARTEYRLALPGTVEVLVDQYEAVEQGRVLYRFRSPSWPELQHEIIEAEQAIANAQSEIRVRRESIGEARARLEVLTDRIDGLRDAEFRNASLEAQAKSVRASLPRLEAELARSQTALANARRAREHALERASAASGIAEEVLTQNEDGRAGYELIDWIDVRASTPGVVERIGATNGAFAHPPDLVVSVVDPRRIRFRATAPQSEQSVFAGGPEARIVAPGGDPGDSVGASVTLGLEAHPRRRTIDVLATPGTMAPWIRPGVSGFLEVVTDASAPASLAIPKACVVQQGLEFVYFRRNHKNPDEVIKTVADQGASNDSYVVIKSGLVKGDEVVLAGAYELKLASDTSGRVQKGGHFHADGTFHAEDH